MKRSLERRSKNDGDVSLVTFHRPGVGVPARDLGCTTCRLALRRYLRQPSSRTPRRTQTFLRPVSTHSIFSTNRPSHYLLCRPVLSTYSTAHTCAKPAHTCTKPADTRTRIPSRTLIICGSVRLRQMHAVGVGSAFIWRWCGALSCAGCIWYCT